MSAGPPEQGSFKLEAMYEKIDANDERFEVMRYSTCSVGPVKQMWLIAGGAETELFSAALSNVRGALVLESESL